MSRRLQNNRKVKNPTSLQLPRKGRKPFLGLENSDLLEKQNDKRVSRVSGWRETRDPAREQERNNNCKPSEALTGCQASLYQLCMYLLIYSLQQLQDCYGSFIDKIPEAWREVKYLTKSRPASKWESKDSNLGSLVPGYATMLCCFVYFLPLPTSVFLCSLAFALTTPLKLLSKVIVASKSPDLIPSQRYTKLSAIFDAVETSSPPRPESFASSLCLSNSPHVHHHCFHCYYPNLILHYFHSFDKHIIPHVRPWGYNGEQSR